MSDRDRSGEIPRPRDSQRRGDPAPRASTPPWRDTDPAEVERYLTGRNQGPRSGGSAELPPVPATDSTQRLTPPRQPPPEAGAPERAAPSGGQNIGRGEPLPPLADPTDPHQWLDPAADPWAEPFDDMAPDVGPAATVDEYDRLPPRRPRPSGQRRPRPARARTPRPMPRPTVPAFVRNAPLVADPVALALLAVSAFGLAVMAATMGSRIGSVSDTVIVHIDAAGNPDRWGPNTTLWRLPLMAVMVTLMNLIGAWFLARRDLFASRFLVAATLGVQIIAWVAVVRYLW